MSRKLNPILAVQQFFETATLDAAQIGLALEIPELVRA